MYTIYTVYPTYPIYPVYPADPVYAVYPVDPAQLVCPVYPVYPGSRVWGLGFTVRSLRCMSPCFDVQGLNQAARRTRILFWGWGIGIEGGGWGVGGRVLGVRS